MALHLSGSAAYLSASTGLTPSTTCTFMGWSMYNNNGFYRALLEHRPNIIGYYIDTAGLLALDNDSTTVNFSSSPAQGSLFAWYLKISGAGANQVEAGWRQLGDAAWVTANHTVGFSGTPTGLRLAGTPFDTCDQDIAAFKAWDVALTSAEIDDEWLTYVPRRFANLNRWIPMIHDTSSAAVKDFSGNGRDLTVNGTIGAVGGPPIPWGGIAGRATRPTGPTTYPLSLFASTSPVALAQRTIGSNRYGVTTPVAMAVRSTTRIQRAVATPTAAVLRATAKGLVATGNGVSALSRYTSRALSAVSTPATAVALMRVFLLSLPAVTSPVGSVRRAVAKGLPAVAVSAGAVQRAISRIIAAATSPTAGLSRALSKWIGAQTAPQGIAAKATARAFPAVTTPTATLGRQVSRRLTATVGATAALVRLIGRALAGVAPGAGAATRAISHREAATAPTTALVTNKAVLAVAFLAVTQPAAVLRRAVDKVLRATGVVETLVQRLLQLVGGPDPLLARQVEGLASDVEILGLASDVEIVGLDIRQDGSVMAVREDLSFGLGEDWIIRLKARNADGSVMDLTGGNVKFAVGRRGGEDPVVQTDTQSGGVTLIDAPNGVALIRLRGISQRDLIGAYAGPLSYIIRAIKADGTPSDQAYGDFEIRRTPLGTP